MTPKPTRATAATTTINQITLNLALGGPAGG
jgi:hypothetical protein